MLIVRFKENMKDLIEKALAFVENYFKNECSGHDYFHTLRVFKLAKQIAIKENANEDIVALAALLHDVDDRKISPETHINKDNARIYVRFILIIAV